MAKTTETKETPLMKQYNQIKAKYPGALLLFRVGDFYETFGEDAITASTILGIVLTRRANGSASHIELAGFPHHSLDSYLPKLVRAGQRVAICDQLEDPKTTKTIVKRGVTEMVTPGISYNDNILQHKANNYLAAIHYADKDELGVALLDISTGEFLVAEGNSAYIDKLFQSFRPAEILCTRGRAKHFVNQFTENYYHYALEDWIFAYDYAYETLTKHFSTLSLKGFGIEGLNNAIIAAGACLHYVYDTQHHDIKHINAIARIEEEQYMWLDKFTLRNLELVHSVHEQATTLFDVLDYTHSPMGARLLRKWILLPLKEKALILERQHLVKVFIENTTYFYLLEEQLKNIGDLERLISKVALQKVNPREIVQLSRALKAILKIKGDAANINDSALTAIIDRINPCLSLIDKIDSSLKADPPVLLQKGNVIADGVDEELDNLRKIAFHGKDYLLDIQRRESERTGITSLKVSFNNVFGYYLEVTHVHKDKVPTEWIRKQTLVNAERYITPELKEYEEKILGAEEKINVIESKLYHNLVVSISEYIKPIQVNAYVVAQLDVLSSFAFVSSRNEYSMPEIVEETVLNIQAGRHPIIEQRLPVGDSFIPNDVFLDQDSQQIIIITGPNMSGKSAILRQTALIVIMAQMGCYVPAKASKIGIVDKLFTRVGASDNQSTGESTFMVEMNETASILNNLSDKSLVLLDEIGRGTSTYDGISIAWAIAEFIHDHSKTRARTLFATHYHELNEMATQMPRIKNYNVSIKELDNKIIFLRKLVPGGSEHSFGIHVAKMAGMPNFIIKRGNEILHQLEKQRSNDPGAKGLHKKKGKTQSSEFQLNMFSLDDPILIKIRDSIKDLNVNELTPVEALMKLDDIQRLLKS